MWNQNAPVLTEGWSSCRTIVMRRDGDSFIGSEARPEQRPSPMMARDRTASAMRFLCMICLASVGHESSHTCTMALDFNMERTTRTEGADYWQWMVWQQLMNPAPTVFDSGYLPEVGWYAGSEIILNITLWRSIMRRLWMLLLLLV